MLNSLPVDEREEDHGGGRTVASITIAVLSKVVVMPRELKLLLSLSCKPLAMRESLMRNVCPV